jgi:hypothetical protein
MECEWCGAYYQEDKLTGYAGEGYCCGACEDAAEGVDWSDHESPGAWEAEDEEDISWGEYTLGDPDGENN